MARIPATRALEDEIKSEGRQQKKPAALDDGFRVSFVPDRVDHAQERSEPDLDEAQEKRQTEEGDRVFQRVDEEERADREPEPAAEERPEDDVGQPEVEGELGEQPGAFRRPPELEIEEAQHGDEKAVTAFADAEPHKKEEERREGDRGVEVTAFGKAVKAGDDLEGLRDPGVLEVDRRFLFRKRLAEIDVGGFGDRGDPRGEAFLVRGPDPAFQADDLLRFAEEARGQGFFPLVQQNVVNGHQGRFVDGQGLHLVFKSGDVRAYPGALLVRSCPGCPRPCPRDGPSRAGRPGKRARH